MTALVGGDEHDALSARAIGEATGRTPKEKKRAKNDVSGEDVVVLASGNLGLVYLMDERRRMTREEIDARHPRLDPGAHARIRTSAGSSSARPSTAPLALGPRGTRHLADGRVDGEDPLAAFSPNATRHLLRTDGFSNVADLMVGSLLRPGPRRGLRVRGADLVPRRPRRPADRAVHPASRRALPHARRAGRRRRGRQRAPARVARRAEGRRARPSDPHTIPTTEVTA